MPARGDDRDDEARRPRNDNGGTEGRAGSRPGPEPPKKGEPAKRRGGLRLKRLGGNDFELSHPRCVAEMELDYAEGIELRQAGDIEAARDALRYALQGCGDNIWVHVALGFIALEDDNDPGLARGHFGYAFELAERALPPDFRGRLPVHRTANQPFYDAINGLAACYDALSKPAESAKLRGLARGLASGQGRAGNQADRRSQSGPKPPDRRNG